MTWTKKRPANHHLAFSLLELLAVVTIIGIIAVITIPRIGASGQTAKENVCHQYKADMNTAIDRYQFDNDTWPALSDLANSEYYPEAIPKCPVDNSSYSLDAGTHRISGHNH